LMISDNVEFLWYCGGNLKMATARNFPMSGINSGRHYLPTYQILMISDNGLKCWVRYLVPLIFLELSRHFKEEFEVPTLKNFYQSSFSKWLPQYRTNSTLSDFNDISYMGILWCPDIEKFLAVTIFKMATTIPHKFNIVRFQQHFICG
jgi:hypothetical protein